MPSSRPSTRHLSPVPDAVDRRPTNLKLSGLPRFHPANFPASSTNSSSASSPASAFTSPPMPLSPRQQYHHFTAHQRQMSDAQRQLYTHQRGTLTVNRYNAQYSPQRSPPPSGAAIRSSRPTSPRLDPLGSPGPVTPFELEERDGYLFAAGASDNRQLSDQAKDEIVDSYIHNETTTGRSSPGAADSRQGHRLHGSYKRGDYTKHRSNLSE